MLNRVIQMGRLTAVPELRRTQSGTAVASFRLAVERDYADKDGKRETDFFDYVAWRSTAECICKHFSKGQMMTIEGTLRNRSWTDKDGNRRQSTEVLVNGVWFAGAKPSCQTESGSPQEFTELPEEDERPF